MSWHRDTQLSAEQPPYEYDLGFSILASNKYMIVERQDEFLE